MKPQPLVQPSAGPEPTVYTDLVHLRTGRSQEFVDLTGLVAERVRRSGITRGIVNVQSCHTTASILVNEFEPELLEDLAELAEQWAPRNRGYRHDVRLGMPPGERANGHSHARAMLLGVSTLLNVDGGAICLGRWQRILLAELDGPRKRTISIMLIGTRDGGGPAAHRWPTRVASGGER
jgi:secondary thiamine-phosphate synthase enzyme